MSANGYLAPSELTSIGNGLFLRTDAAKSFLSMAADAESDGVQINWPGIASAYRPWVMQLDMRVHPDIYGINPNMHALPGLPSSHGTGLARDVPFGAPNDWMIANAARFGWTRPERTLKLNDLNHWEFVPGTATASLDATPIEQEEDDMSRIIHHPNGSMALAGSDGTFIPLTTMDEVAALIGTGAVPKDYVNLADGLMWNLRTAIAARKAAQASTNPQAVAAALAPLIVPAVITALGKGLTQAQVEQVTETAVRAVFADAAK